MAQNVDKSSKGRNANEKVQQYSEEQTQIIYRVILLRQTEADNSIRKNAPFTGVYSHLAGQLNNRNEKSIKTKVMKTLKTDNRSPSASLLNVPFFHEAMAQALLGKASFESEHGLPNKKGTEEEETRCSTAASLGKRTPLHDIEFSYISPDHLVIKLENREFDSYMETESKADIDQDSFVGESELMAIPLRHQQPGTDLDKRADNVYYNDHLQMFQIFSNSIESSPGQQSSDQQPNLELEALFGSSFSDQKKAKDTSAMDEPFYHELDIFS